MERTPVLPLPEGILIAQIQVTQTGLLISVRATHPTACCPVCACVSCSIKCHDRRSLRDVACGGRQVQLVLTVRKIYCRNPAGERKVLAERLADFVEPWARVTMRHREQITGIGLATCGKGGTRLAARLGLHLYPGSVFQQAWPFA